MVPWLARCDQDTVFPNNLSFETPSEQEVCMREWVHQRTGLYPEFDIVWYPGASLSPRSCCREWLLLSISSSGENLGALRELSKIYYVIFTGAPVYVQGATTA